MWVSIYSINQSQVQRYISCKTLGHAKMWAHLRPLPLSFALSGTKRLRQSFCLSCFRSLYVNMVGLWVTVSLAVFSGLTMFSIYKNCDPLSNGDVNSTDEVNATGCFSTAAVSRATRPRWSKVFVCVNQLLPYLVMDMLASYPGIPGLFVAAAYSGTLRWGQSMRGIKLLFFFCSR